MGKNNQQRRAAKATDRLRHTGPAASPPAGPPPAAASSTSGSPFIRQPGSPQPTPQQRRRDTAYEALQKLSRLAARLPATALPYAVESYLADQDDATGVETERLVVAELMARLSIAWEHGWQPQDVRHAAGKRSARLDALVSSLITEQSRATRARDRAPQAWQAQLDLVADGASVRSAGTGEHWQPVLAMCAQGAAYAQAWADVLGVIKLLAELGSLPPLGPPPSQWQARPATTSRVDGSDRDRLLGKIRALLAKAEATDHPAEAETFTAKAQELMTRHAIDDALLHADREEAVEVVTRRVHLQSPYASTKMILLGSVARANRARAIYFGDVAIASVVGTPVDVDQVELLFTSLLIQATRAMAAAGRDRAGSYDRSTTFRRSFLAAYATRIGERLTEADEVTRAEYGTELVPLMKRQSAAVEAEFERLFPRTRPLNTGYLDSRGWHAGREAADKAVFVAGRLTG